MFNRKAVLTAFGAFLALAMAATVSAQWFNPRQTMELTFSGPVALPDVLLVRSDYTQMKTGIGHIQGDPLKTILKLAFCRT